MQCTQMIEYKKLESNAQNTEGWTHTLILNKSFSGQLTSFAPLSANHWPPVGHKPLLDILNTGSLLQSAGGTELQLGNILSGVFM